MKKLSVTQRQFDMIVKGYRVGGFVLVVGTLATFSILLNKTIEYAIMFLSYFLIKGKYRLQYHSHSMKECLLLSLIIFAIAILSCVPLKYSIVFCGVMGILIAYLSYRAGYVQLLLKDYAYIEPRYNELIERLESESKFKINTASYDEIKQRCRSLNMSSNAIEFCLYAFTDFYGKRYNDSELADHFCIEVQSAKNKKRLYRKKLEK